MNSENIYAIPCRKMCEIMYDAYKNAVDDFCKEFHSSDQTNKTIIDGICNKSDLMDMYQDRNLSNNLIGIKQNVF